MLPIRDTGQIPKYKQLQGKRMEEIYHGNGNKRPRGAVFLTGYPSPLCTFFSLTMCKKIGNEILNYCQI